MHRPLFLATAVGVAAAGGLLVASAMPAGAATSVRAETMARTTTDPSASTPVTFSLTTTGVLAITAPTGTVDLGGGVVHDVGTIIGSPNNFGDVTVTDNRALHPADWTATVSSTDFTNAAGDTIPATDATYLTGAIVADTNSGLPLAGTTSGTITDDTGTGLGLTNGAQDVVTESGFDGDNAATWDPTIDVAVPAGAVVGIYDGTVTHSVS